MPNSLIVLFLIIVANGTPVIAYDIFKHRFSRPLDFGIRLPDTRCLLGPSKTIRGIVLSLLATAVVARLAGFSFLLGAGLAGAAMAGDLLSSFVKRRLGREAGSQALMLDQVPEALFPALAVKNAFSLSSLDIAAVVGAFVIFELVASRFLFKLHLRKHPY